MRQLERRQIVLIGVLVALIVAFLVWKVVLSGGGNSNTVQPSTTVTSVANAQSQSQQQSSGSAQLSTGAANGTSGTTAPVDPPFDPQAYRDPFVPAG